MKISYTPGIICKTIWVRITSFFVELVLKKNGMEFGRNGTKEAEFEFSYLISTFQSWLETSIKMRLNLEQWQFVIEKHFEKLSTKEISTEIRKEWTKRTCPDRNTIMNIVNRWKVRGSILGKENEKNGHCEIVRSLKIREKHWKSSKNIIP